MEIYFVGLLNGDSFFCYAEDDYDAMNQACAHYRIGYDAINEAWPKSKTVHANDQVYLNDKWVV